MKTDKNSQYTQSGTPAQPQQTVPDNKRLAKYEARFLRTHLAKVIIIATSLAEAEKLAEAVNDDDIRNWDPDGGEVFLESVEAVSEGQSHD